LALRRKYEAVEKCQLVMPIRMGKVRSVATRLDGRQNPPGFKHLERLAKRRLIAHDGGQFAITCQLDCRCSPIKST